MENPEINPETRVKLGLNKALDEMMQARIYGELLEVEQTLRRIEYHSVSLPECRKREKRVDAHTHIFSAREYVSAALTDMADAEAAVPSPVPTPDIESF